MSWTDEAWEDRVIAFVDVVESVRLMAQDERGTIARWRALVQHTRATLLAQHGGRIVKSLGDGMLLEFDRVSEAVAVAHALHAWLDDTGRERSDRERMALRIGVHCARVFRDEHDLYGSDVNVGARIAASAEPGQTRISAAACAQLLPAIDGEPVDLGEVYLKHVERTVRLFALRRPGSAEPVRLPRAPTLGPRIGVTPFTVDAPGLVAAWGLAVSDQLVQTMARSAGWAVASRLSTSALQGRRVDSATAARLLDVDYLVTGLIGSAPGGLEIRYRVIERQSGLPVHEGAQPWRPGERRLHDDASLQALALSVAHAVLDRQVHLAAESMLPTLSAHTLLLGAVARLHSLGRDDMRAAQEMLDHLADRHPRAAEVPAWLAKAHFLQIAQVTDGDTDAALRRARGQLHRALNLDPQHGLALALEGHLLAYAEGDVGAACEALAAAVQAAPNEPLAHLFRAQALADSGQPEAAVRSAETASALSPLDPMAYYHHIFLASAYSAAGRHDDALRHTRRSLELNTLHLSSWVQLIVDLALASRMDEARAAASHYRVMRPGASVKRYLDHHAGRDQALGRRNAQALVEAGIPW